MDYFYANLLHPMDKGEALQQAVEKMREEYPDPFYWAPFIVTGDWK